MVHRMPIIRTTGEIARDDVAAGKDYDPPKPDWFGKHFASNETLNKIAEARAEYHERFTIETLRDIASETKR